MSCMWGTVYDPSEGHEVWKADSTSPGRGLETRSGATVTGKVGEPCSGQWQQDGEEDVCSGEQEKEVSAHKGGVEGSSMPQGIEFFY